MGITHTTPADGTFSGTGATAWNADHTITDNTITYAKVQDVSAASKLQKLKPKEAEVLGLEPNRKRKVIILPSEHKEIEEAIETINYFRRQEEEWLILQ